MVIVAFPPGEKYAVNYTTLDQYDYGQVLRIQGLKLPKTVEVHFSTQETGGTSITRVGVTKDGVTDVLIPDSVLENGDTTQNYSIFAFVYITDATSGKTEYRAKLEVKARPKPEVPGGGDNPDIFHEAVLEVRKTAEKAEEAQRQAEGWAHGREDLPERAEDNAMYYAGKASEDAKKTAQDRAEVERLTESNTQMQGEVAKDLEEVKNLSSQAQTSATNAALSEQKSKEAATRAETAQTGAETAKGNAELAAQKTGQDKTAVEQAKKLVQQMGQEVLNNKNAVDKTVQDFNFTAQQALADVNNAGQTQTERVQSAGTTAVENIENAQNTATQAVQTAAQEIIADREQINTNKEGVAQLKEEIEELKDNGTGSGTGLSTEAINKLDEIGNHIPFASATGGTLWDELIVLLRNGSSGDDSGSGGDTTATPTSISATYTGGEVTTGTALSDLTGITVTATYSDGTTKTVTGYTLSGEILEGENTITVSYSGLTNTFTVTGIVESGGGDTTAELVTDGLVSYFDFRTCEYNNAGSGGSTLIQPTQGSGQLYTWANNAVTEQSADYGVRVSRGFMYAENGGTNQSECGESFTWVFNSYLTSLSNPMFSTDYGALSTTKKLQFEPMYNTSDSTAQVATKGFGIREIGYNLLFLVVDNNICKLYFGNELIKEIDGNTIDGFVSWYSKLFISILGGIDRGYMSQLAIYNKALSDVEITEMQEYLKDLEVA